MDKYQSMKIVLMDQNELMNYFNSIHLDIQIRIDQILPFVAAK